MALESDLPNKDNWSIRHRVTTFDMAKLGDAVVFAEVVTEVKGFATVPGKGWPDLTFTFQVRDGDPMCVNMTITSKLGDRPIRTPDLVTFNVEALAIQAFTDTAPEQVEPGVFRWGSKNKDVKESDIAHAVRTNNEPAKFAELRKLAEIYSNPDYRKAPVVAVWNLLYGGKDVTSRKTVSNRIKAARGAHLLPQKGSAPEELDRYFILLTSGHAAEFTMAQEKRLIEAIPGSEAYEALLEAFILENQADPDKYEKALLADRLERLRGNDSEKA
jgi:hypothetical protein